MEAAEILEHFQFQEMQKTKKELASELADVALYLLQLASVTDIDLEKAILKRLKSTKHENGIKNSLYRWSSISER